jgi:signal transduction histidine kinase/CHASE3 domain sensor protein
MNTLLSKLHSWWDRLTVEGKDGVAVLILSVPLILVLVIHISLLHQLRSVQQRSEAALIARDQVNTLARLAVDIEDAFRGYLLTEQDAFLQPMLDATSKFKTSITQVLELAAGLPEISDDLRKAIQRLDELLLSKQELVQKIRTGQAEEVLRYVRSGKGLMMSKALRVEVRGIVDRLDQRQRTLQAEEEALTNRAFWGLIAAVILGLALGWVTLRLLRRSITQPLSALQASVAKFGEEPDLDLRSLSMPIGSSDEIGKLARSCNDMFLGIRRHIHELETINAIGNEINTISPEGMYGVLRRITDRAAEMLAADVCLVMLRHEQISCWVIEAASHEWHDKLRKSVVLWDEFAIAARAFETRKAAMGEDLPDGQKPEVIRRNLMGESLLAIPLLYRGEPFGVLLFLVERRVPRTFWNLRLAKGFADEAAIAISNARLYEAATNERKGLERRLRQLEHLAEMLAHDLKGPGERMGYLAARLHKEYGDGRRPLDEQAVRWLDWLVGYGQTLTQRVESILEVARVGAGVDAMEAIDPAIVVAEVLKARAGELEARNVKVKTVFTVLLVPCHREYLRQVFDNLISNVLKYACNRPDPELRIIACRQGDWVKFTVSDNGPGIPLTQRPRVFDPFVRLDSDAKGSGIGLTIVKRIVELYGGDVWVEDDDVPGCRIAFTLPTLGDLSPAAAQRPAVEASKEMS